ncbi:MAG: lipopolysaccharide biosynthesis protein [Gammaproteobacteria bacterium]|nr:lipopolysaccharide biosynthesis protein [Gammaproteobacteria bacterium]MBU1654318.1 lipopolysaccharide biosynthesis protein [Gammaproteobacteria bacterium]MBU1961207.1 lipopolysaccharide biosynthesis protein [Gammaproteobacteria bacterium]
MAEESRLTIDDYLYILRRRWVYLVFPFLIISLVSLAFALLLPPVFKSTGTILVESQQIPVDLIRSTITSYADERIQFIKERVMTRGNLLRIIKEFDIFAAKGASLTAAEQVDKFRERVEILPIKSDLQQGGTATIAFTVSFEHVNPDIAFRVADKLVHLFLEENIRTRTERASETTEFLTGEAGKFKKQLEQIEARIAEYKQQYSEALPEHLDLHMKMLERTGADIKIVEREILTAQEEERFLEVQLSAARMGITDSEKTPATLSPSQQLARLKGEYAQLLSVYSPDHPDVRSVKRKIDNLSRVVGAEGTRDEVRRQLADAEAEKVALQANYAADHPEMKRLVTRIAKLRADLQALPKGSGADRLAEETQSIDEARVQTKIDAAAERLRSLIAQLDELKKKRQKLEEQVIETPQVERALVSLNRDYENTLKKYNEIQNKQMEAKLAENLEESKKAERFSLLEAPVVPEKPIKPKRKKIVVMGLVLALAGAGGLVMMLESLDQRIRGAHALEVLLHRRPLVVIPYITTQEEIQRRRYWTRVILTGAGIALLLLLILVHFFYMPLGLLLVKTIAGLG